MQITKRSVFTGKEHTREVDVTQVQLDAWKSSGQMIQNALPHLNPDDREFLMTGVTPEEWSAVFDSKEDGEEDGTGNDVEDAAF